MIIHYLTWLKHRIGKDFDEIDIPETVQSISELIDYLCSLSHQHQQTLQHKQNIYAESSGQILDHNEKINNLKELSLFAPIVGG